MNLTFESDANLNTLINILIYNHLQGNSMKAVTSRDLMFKSVCFRLVLGLTVTACIVAMILGIISTNVTCHYQNCSATFYYSTIECKSNGVNYCCGDYNDPGMPSYSCGGYYYCFKNPNAHRLC
jgi:hypothetical protein